MFLQNKPNPTEKPLQDAGAGGIPLCKPILPTRFRLSDSEERGCKFFRGSSPRVLASQLWFLFQIEPDFHLLSQTREWS